MVLLRLPRSGSFPTDSVSFEAFHPSATMISSREFPAQHHVRRVFQPIEAGCVD